MREKCKIFFEIKIIICVCVCVLLIMEKQNVYAAGDGYTSAQIFVPGEMVIDNLDEIEYLVTSEVEKDYFTFELDEPGYINLEFVHEELEGDSIYWMLYIQDNNRNTIYTEYIYGNYELTKSPNIGLDRGKYYILVTHYDVPNFSNYSGEEYRFKINYYKSYKWEKEFNNTYVSADIVEPGEEIWGAIVGEDRYEYEEDYYVLDVKESGYFNIIFKHKNITNYWVDWSLHLEDSNRNVIKSLHLAGDKKTNSLRQVYLSQGKYYLIVKVGDSGIYGYNAISNDDYSIKCNYTLPKPYVSMATSNRHGYLKLKWEKLKNCSGYEVVISTNKNFKNKKVIDVKNKKKYTFKNLKNKKYYYVKLRGYRIYNGKKYYGSYCKFKKVYVEKQMKR